MLKTACFSNLFVIPPLSSIAKSYAPHLMAYCKSSASEVFIILMLYIPHCDPLQKTLVIMCCYKKLVIYNFWTFDRTLKATRPLGDSAFNPMSAMSSSLWHKTGRGCFSPLPNLAPIQSALAETSSLQKESSYSSLQGHADGTNGSQSSHSKHSYSYQTMPDYNEGNIHTLFLLIKLLISII